MDSMGLPSRKNLRNYPKALSGALLAAACAFSFSGCEWKGLNSLPLPGAEGRGAGAFEVTVNMPDVTTLTLNSPVRVGDVEVGSIKAIKTRDYIAVVTVSLNSDVKLPQNAWAKIGQTSLLGSQHLELTPPPNARAFGHLGDGDVIPLEHAGVYPTTEQTLAALSVVLTNGGLEQFQDIAKELNRALDDGRVVEAKEVLTRIKDAVAALDKQKDSIVTALEGLDRLSGTVRGQNDTLQKALSQLPEATGLLRDQRAQLASAVTTLGDLGNKAGTLARLGGDDLVANLRNLEPTLRALADTGQNLTQVMDMLITFPFPQSGLDNFLKGDFANLYIDADATMPRLQESLLLGTDLGNRMAGLEGVVGLAPAPMSNANPYELRVPQDQEHHTDPKQPVPGAAQGEPGGARQ